MSDDLTQGGYRIVALWCEIGGITEHQKSGYTLTKSSDDRGGVCRAKTPDSRTLTAKATVCRAVR